jgi:hypothetical protein
VVPRALKLRIVMQKLGYPRGSQTGSQSSPLRSTKIPRDRCAKATNSKAASVVPTASGFAFVPTGAAWALGVSEPIMPERSSLGPDRGPCRDDEGCLVAAASCTRATHGRTQTNTTTTMIPISAPPIARIPTSRMRSCLVIVAFTFKVRGGGKRREEEGMS